MEYLLNISLRSMVLAAVALMIVWPMRSAAAKHAVWTIVAMGILLQIVLSPVLPSVLLRVLRNQTKIADSVQIASTSPAPVDLAPPTFAADLAAPAPNRFRFTWSMFWSGLYFAGLAIFAMRLAAAFLFTRKLLRDSTSIGPNRYQSTRVTVPMTFGSKIILPIDWSKWSDGKLNAVLQHEEAHGRRGDWWIALLSRVNHCVLWFHPLTWWLDRELARLAEQACDDAALVTLQDREQYALTLLDMARAAHASQGRLLASAMAKESDVEVRMDRILDEARNIPHSLGCWSWSALVAVGMPLIYLGAVVQLAPAAPAKTSSPVPVKTVPRATSLVAATEAVAHESVAGNKSEERVFVAQASPRGETPPAATADTQKELVDAALRQLPPKLTFEVATIKPSPPKPNLPAGLVPAPILEGGPGTATPERINYSNFSLWSLMVQAFDIKSMQLVSPQWASTGLFDVIATIPAGATKAQVRTMLQNLLIDRFHLTLHHETRILPVYALLVGKNGLQLKESGSTSEPVPPGTVIGTADKEGFPTLPPGYAGTVARPGNGRLRIAGQRQTLAQLAGMVQSPLLDHPIVDQTGLTGLYDFKLEIEWMTRSAAPAGDVLDAPPTVFQALDKLGLKLELKQLPYDVLIVDQIDKVPTEN